MGELICSRRIGSSCFLSHPPFLLWSSPVKVLSVIEEKKSTTKEKWIVRNSQQWPVRDNDRVWWFFKQAIKMYIQNGVTWMGVYLDCDIPTPLKKLGSELICSRRVGSSCFLCHPPFFSWSSLVKVLSVI